MLITPLGVSGCRRFGIIQYFFICGGRLTNIILSVTERTKEIVKVQSHWQNGRKYHANFYLKLIDLFVRAISVPAFAGRYTEINNQTC